MLFKSIFVAFTVLSGALAGPIPKPDELVSVAAAPSKGGRPCPFPQKSPLKAIGMKGQKRRSLSLDELTYLGAWDNEQGCSGTAKRSGGRTEGEEAFGALFSNDVQAAAISITTSGSQRVFVGTGHVWDLKNVSAPVAPCHYSQAITFTGIRMATPPDVQIAEGNPLRGTNTFAYLRLPMDVINIQRQWLQVNKVTLYASFMDMWTDLKGYEREQYMGPPRLD